MALGVSNIVSKAMILGGLSARKEGNYDGTLQVVTYIVFKFLYHLECLIFINIWFTLKFLLLNSKRF